MSRQHNHQFPRPDEVLLSRADDATYLDGIDSLGSNSGRGFWTPQADHCDMVPMVSPERVITAVTHLGLYVVSVAREKAHIVVPPVEAVGQFEDIMYPFETYELQVRTLGVQRCVMQGTVIHDQQTLATVQISGTLMDRDTAEREFFPQDDTR